MENLGNGIYSISAGEKINITNIVPKFIEKYAIMQERYGKNNYRYTRLRFFKPCIISAEGLTQKKDNLPSFFHLRSVRDYNSYPIAETYIYFWIRLRKILNENFEKYANLGVQYIHASGGLENAAVCKNEILIADYSMSGAHGYIVPKDLIGIILKENPLPAEEVEKLSKELEVLKEVYLSKFTAENYYQAAHDLFQHSDANNMRNAYYDLMDREDVCYNSPFWYKMINNMYDQSIGCEMQQTYEGEYLVKRERQLRNIGNNQNMELGYTTQKDWQTFLKDNLNMLQFKGLTLQLIYKNEIINEVTVTSEMVEKKMKQDNRELEKKIRNLEKLLDK